MNKEIRVLEPKNIWNKFADLNAVPRPSKHEERVIAFMMDFGRNSAGTFGYGTSKKCRYRFRL